MSKLQNKRCSLYKEPCLITGCAQYDDRLDACVFNLASYNLYKVANAIEQAVQELTLNQQPVKQPEFQFPRRK